MPRRDYSCWRLDVLPASRRVLVVNQTSSIEAAKQAARALIPEHDQVEYVQETMEPLYIAVQARGRKPKKHRIVFWIQEDADPAKPLEPGDEEHA